MDGNRVGIIGGTGVYDPSLLSGAREVTVDTPFGRVTPLLGEFGNGLATVEVVFLARHGSGHSVPPHHVNYRANIWALKRLGVGRVVATAAVGGLNDAGPGDFILVDQFLDFTRGRSSTFFEGGDLGVAHVDMTEPYCPFLRKTLVQAGEAMGVAVRNGGVYVCTEGPRFETPAEIRMFAQLGGDVVGMTGVPEVVLARELGLCYATVATVTNSAAGISSAPLTHSEVLEVMAKNTTRLRGLLAEFLKQQTVKCACDNCRPPEVFGARRGVMEVSRND